MLQTKAKRGYIAINLPRQWETYLKEALENPEVQKQLEIAGLRETASSLGRWIIHQFLIEHTSLHFEHLNTYENRVTIADNKTRSIITIYPKESGKLWCEYCDSFDCEHIHFVLTIPDVTMELEKRGWKYRGDLKS